MSTLVHDDPSVLRRAVAERSVRRFAAATGLIGVACALVEFGVFLTARPSNEFAPLFSGWQVDLVGGASAAILLAAAAACIYALRQLGHVRAELGKHRRLALLVAILPGLILSAGLYSAASRAVNWASDHTAAANAARTLLSSYRLAPPKMPSRYPRAPAALAARLLTSTDLGPGWYDDIEVNPVSMPLAFDAKSQGQIGSVRSIFSQEHRTDPTTWFPDITVFEELRTFDSAAQASSYLDSWTHARQADSLSSGIVGGVSITRGSTRSGRLAAFTVGGAVFTLDASTSISTAATANVFDELVQRAVSRALSSA